MKIQIENQQKRIKVDKRKLRVKVTKLLKLTDCVNKEISITFVDDETIQRINKKYLSKDRPTNVISFSLQEGEFGNINPEILGDIVISVDTARKDAEKSDLSFDEELLFLIIHGLLHLLGYNHESKSKENTLRMQQTETKLFRLITQPD